MALHCTVTGDGPPAVFVHGSFGWGLDTFGKQQALADTHRVVLVDRAGYGGSAAGDRPGWPGDVPDVVAVLDGLGGAHLVGQSYGSVVALLCAQARPDLVRSLVVIEPPLFQLAPDDAEAARKVDALDALAAVAPELSTREFVVRWAIDVMGRSADGVTEWMASWDEADWRAAEATRREQMPTTAPTHLAAVRSSAVPKVVAVGAWDGALFPGRSLAGGAFRAVADRLGSLIGAQVVEFARSAHNPQLEQPVEFNAMIRSVWARSA